MELAEEERAREAEDPRCAGDGVSERDGKCAAPPVGVEHEDEDAVLEALVQALHCQPERRVEGRIASHRQALWKPGGVVLRRVPRPHVGHEEARSRALPVLPGRRVRCPVW